jgi:hypothetical protein
MPRNHAPDGSRHPLLPAFDEIARRLPPDGVAGNMEELHVISGIDAPAEREQKTHAVLTLIAGIALHAGGVMLRIWSLASTPAVLSTSHRFRAPLDGGSMRRLGTPNQHPRTCGVASQSPFNITQGA